MFDDLLDIFDRDRDKKRSGARPGGLRGLLARLGDHDDDRSHRRREHDDDDRRYDRDDDDHRHRRRRDRFDFDDD